MSRFHNKENKITEPIATSLNVNITLLEALFKDSSDIIKRKYLIGGVNKVNVYIIYIDNMVDKFSIEEDIIEYFLYNMEDLPNENQFNFIKDKKIRSADMSVAHDMNKVVSSVLAGETVVLVDGYDKGICISLRKYPGRGVPTSENEVAVRGSKESFTESLSVNRVLIRKRVKDTNLKMKAKTIGTRTLTSVSIMYIDDIVKPELLEEVEKRIGEYCIDGILDSGMLEQLMEKNVYSPFPEFQSTERPDKVSSALLEGRVAILVDNSPMAIIAPATFSSFFQASDDSYSRWEIASFTRVIRYLAAFITMALPGLYIAVINFQPEVLSSAMALSFSAAREGVPFSVLFEVIMMEVAFQMLLEAGIRLPGPMGSTLGIVGGLIIGDAAVNANIVSPIVVIVIALTAISAFTVPNEAFSSAFRLIRYIIIFLSAFLGLYGFILGCMAILIHLAGLTSFGIPYLQPFDATGINNGSDLQDAIIRFPLKKQFRRPIFARKDQRIRLKKKDKKK